MTVLKSVVRSGSEARRRSRRADAYTALVDQAEVTARQMQRLLAGGDDRFGALRQFLGVLSDDQERALIALVGRIDEDGTR
jgi:hypothetical protein